MFELMVVNECKSQTENDNNRKKFKHSPGVFVRYSHYPGLLGSRSYPEPPACLNIDMSKCPSLVAKSFYSNIFSVHLPMHVNTSS